MGVWVFGLAPITKTVLFFLGLVGILWWILTFDFWFMSVCFVFQEMSPGVYSAMGSVMAVSMDSPSSARPPTKSPVVSVMESYS